MQIKHHHHSRLWKLIVSSFLLACSASANSDSFEFSVESILKKTAEQIDANYVFPELGTSVAQHLNALAESSETEWASEPDAFAKQVTEILQELTADKHMRIRWQDPRSNNKRVRHRLGIPPEKDNFGIQKIQRFENNIILVKLTQFYANTESHNAIAAVMQLIENADAVIWDIRENVGGDPQTVNQIFSHYMEAGIDYISFYDRDGNVRGTMTTREELNAKRNLEIPVFVLTSKNAFSAAEEFAYNFKTFERGVLVGETTGGGANPGGRFPVESNFQVFVPTGRPVNPLTQTNWEGVGVVPDIEVPADEALAKAIQEAMTRIGNKK